MVEPISPGSHIEAVVANDVELNAGIVLGKCWVSECAKCGIQIFVLPSSLHARIDGYAIQIVIVFTISERYAMMNRACTMRHNRPNRQHLIPGAIITTECNPFIVTWIQKCAHPHSRYFGPNHGLELVKIGYSPEWFCVIRSANKGRLRVKS